jgi:hypothetical protein
MPPRRSIPHPWGIARSRRARTGSFSISLTVCAVCGRRRTGHHGVAVRALAFDGSAAAFLGKRKWRQERPDLGRVADAPARGAPPGAVRTVGAMHCEASPWDSPPCTGGRERSPSRRHPARSTPLGRCTPPQCAGERERSPSRRHPATTRLARNASPPFAKARLAAGEGEAVPHSMWIGPDFSPSAAICGRQPLPGPAPPYAPIFSLPDPTSRR